MRMSATALFGLLLSWSAFAAPCPDRVTFANGVTLKNGNDYNYPSGTFLIRGTTVYYPDGPFLMSGGNLYYSGGTFFKHDKDFYYESGTWARHDGKLYREDGTPSPFSTVELESPIGTFGEFGYLAARLTPNGEELYIGLTLETGYPGETLYVTVEGNQIVCSTER